MSDATIFSRRRFVQTSLIGMAACAMPAALEAKLHSVVSGVHVGMQTFSLRLVRYPDIVSAVQQVGTGEVELFSTQVEPTAADAPDIMKWRDTISLDYFKDIRKKFDQAGIDIFSYNPRFGAGGGRGRGGPAAPGGPGGSQPGGAGGTGGPGGPPTPPPQAPPPTPITDAQIDRIFEFTKALGAKHVAAGMTADMAKRLVPFAEKHKTIVAVASSDPAVLSQVPAMSPWLRMDVDIGDFTRNGHDALQFVKGNYQHLLDVHLKDCKFRGTSVPFGQGDSHMKEVLQFLRDKKSQARAMIDCDYPGTGTSVDEVKKCYDYIKSCLA
jgi:hypothetical protein